MKQLFCLAVLFLLFWVPSATAQKNTFTTDLRYYPIANSPVYGASLGYYRQVSERRALGLKFSLTANDPNGKGLYIEPKYLLVAHLDITNRWQMSHNKKSNWYVEAGISGLYMLERRPPYTLLCGTGLTPEELARSVEYASKSHQTTLFSPGLSTAVSWDYALTPRLSVGLICLANIYFLDSDNFSNLLLLPSLHSAYRF